MTSVRRVLLGSMLVLSVLLAGCGGSDADEEPVASETSSPEGAGDETTTPPADETTPPADEGCGTVGQDVADAVGDPAVTDVQVIGQCTSVSIATDLADDAFDAEVKEAALAICEAAATVAYQEDVNAVRVESQGGTELAIGIKDAPCI